jgi:hypothetical protein
VPDCGAFDLRDRFTVVFNGTLFFDSDGNVSRVVEHVAGSDTFYNSVTRTVGNRHDRTAAPPKLP